MAEKELGIYQNKLEPKAFKLSELGIKLMMLNFQSFFEDLPELLKEHEGEYAAYRLGLRLCLHHDKDALIQQMHEKYDFDFVTILYIH